MNRRDAKELKIGMEEKITITEVKTRRKNKSTVKLQNQRKLAY